MQPDNPQPSKDQPDPLELYNTVAETVGGVSLRWMDNLYQGAAILAAILIGAVVGFLLADFTPIGAVVGALGGLIVGFFLSGVVLMIVGWVRAARLAQRIQEAKKRRSNE